MVQENGGESKENLEGEPAWIRFHSCLSKTGHEPHPPWVRCARLEPKAWCTRQDSNLRP